LLHQYPIAMNAFRLFKIRNGTPARTFLFNMENINSSSRVTRCNIPDWFLCCACSQQRGGIFEIAPSVCSHAKKRHHSRTDTTSVTKFKVLEQCFLNHGPWTTGGPRRSGGFRRKKHCKKIVSNT
jgi:hypothetical protein